MRHSRLVSIIGLFGLLALASLACGGPATGEPAPAGVTFTPVVVPSPAATLAIIPTGQAHSVASPAGQALARYDLLSVDVRPSAPSYTFDLATIGNPAVLGWLGPAQQDALEANGFVVLPQGSDSIHEIYQRAEQTGIPPFVTSDAVLHVFHVLYGASLQYAEAAHFADDLRQLSVALVSASQEQLQVSEASVRPAAQRNLAYFSVAAALMDPDFELPGPVASLVREELTLIEGQNGVYLSPIFGYLVDYTQFTARGHYAGNAILERYFRAMSWYGRIGLRASVPGAPLLARLETRQVMLMVSALHQNSLAGATLLEVWERIYLPTVFIVSATDDLTVYDYQAAAEAVYGKLPGPADLADEERLSDLIATILTLRAPGVLAADLDSAAVTAPRQFRFMGQRSLPDSEVLNQLVYSRVGLYQGTGTPFTLVQSQVGPIRGLARGLDVPAVLGSKRARQILAADGDSDYDGYLDQVAQLAMAIDALPADRWHATLYWNWLFALQPLLEDTGRGYPPFMQTDAWRDKTLQTWLGSWTELRHDSILYAKQSSAAQATGAEPLSPPHGYVEPLPAVYARLAGLARQMLDGLDGRDLLGEELRARFIGMEDLLLTLKTVAEKELRAESLSEVEILFIGGIGDRLERLTTFDELSDDQSSRAGQRQALVVDLHTDPNSGQVSQAAIGDALPIYVIVQVEGQQWIALGGVFSVYEFKQPLADRMTDADWQALDPRPGRPEWTASFIVP